MLDGLRLAAAVVGAERGYVYVSDPEAAHSVESALGELDPDTLGGVTVTLSTVPAGYVAGEETAAVRALNGGPAKPTDKPPRPFEAGVGDRPTLVSNVETLANLPFLQSHGASAFRAQGTPCRRAPSWPPSAGPAGHRCSTSSSTARPSPNSLPCTVSRPTQCAAR